MAATSADRYNLYLPQTCCSTPSAIASFGIQNDSSEITTAIVTGAILLTFRSSDCLPVNSVPIARVIL
jgi:hypothetical protein